MARQLRVLTTVLVSSEHCSELRSQNLHAGSQLPVPPVPGDLMPLLISVCKKHEHSAAIHKCMQSDLEKKGKKLYL